MKDKSIQEEIRENIAERIHSEWCDWSLNLDEKEKLSPERIERWKKYWVDYSELPEDIKEKDRQWADEILKYLNEKGARLLKTGVYPIGTYEGLVEE